MQSRLGPPPDVGGVVFDMDGVLVNSSEIHRQAFEELLTPLGVPFEYNRFAGRRTLEVLREAFAAREPAYQVTEEQLADYAVRKSGRSRELLAAANGNLMPGCVKVLTALADRFVLALASSGSRSSVQAFLESAQLHHVFRVVLTGDDVTQAKPDPEIFRRAMAQLGVEPARCVVIEDSVAGVEAARLAGARPIGFGRTQSAALQAAGAEEVIDSLEELPALFGAKQTTWL